MSQLSILMDRVSKLEMDLNATTEVNRLLANQIDNFRQRLANVEERQDEWDRNIDTEPDSMPQQIQALAETILDLINDHPMLVDKSVS